MVKMRRTNLSLLTFPPPGSGPVLAAILNIIQVRDQSETSFYWGRKIQISESIFHIHE